MFQSVIDENAQQRMTVGVYVCRRTERIDKKKKKLSEKTTSACFRRNVTAHHDTGVLVPDSVQFFSSGLMIRGVMSNVAFTLITGRALYMHNTQRLGQCGVLFWLHPISHLSLSVLFCFVIKLIPTRKLEGKGFTYKGVKVLQALEDGSSKYKRQNSCLWSFWWKTNRLLQL